MDILAVLFYISVFVFSLAILGWTSYSLFKRLQAQKSPTVYLILRPYTAFISTEGIAILAIRYMNINKDLLSNFTAMNLMAFLITTMSFATVGILSGFYSHRYGLIGISVIAFAGTFILFTYPLFALIDLTLEGYAYWKSRYPRKPSH